MRPWAAGLRYNKPKQLLLKFEQAGHATLAPQRAPEPFEEAELHSRGMATSVIAQREEPMFSTGNPPAHGSAQHRSCGLIPWGDPLSRDLKAAQLLQVLCSSVRQRLDDKEEASPQAHLPATLPAPELQQTLPSLPLFSIRSILLFWRILPREPSRGTCTADAPGPFCTFLHFSQAATHLGCTRRENEDLTYAAVTAGLSVLG